MNDPIHRDALSSWQALSEKGGLDTDYRDEDLKHDLKKRLDPRASTLEEALAGVSTSAFLSALFGSIQPFMAMFRDILGFFKEARARQGQSQWRIRIDDTFLEFKHFQEFIEHWNTIEIEFEVPALDLSNAFILSDIRSEVVGSNAALDREEKAKLPADVEAWLAAYDQGLYEPFPASMVPDKYPSGLKDAATLALAVLTTLRRQKLDRDRLLDALDAQGFQPVHEDIFHPSTIAQIEHDRWLAGQVRMLAEILVGADNELNGIAVRLAEFYAAFPRRQLPGELDVKDLERLLSLPIWKKRYETYGVWVATRIIASLEDHDYEIRSEKGELKFAFREAEIADINTSQPKLTLFSERWVSLKNPKGKNRKGGVQPDFGLWTQDAAQPRCVLVVEVKHYKQRSKQNFCDALWDYSRAHPRAIVALVNYGPVGEDFTELPAELGKRCRMIGHLTPENPASLAEFSDLVREIVGDPVRPWVLHQTTGEQVLALDVSGSMHGILDSRAFREFLAKLATSGLKVALIDKTIRDVVENEEVERWLNTQQQNNSTALADPVAKLLDSYTEVLVLTDEGGEQDLNTMQFTRLQTPMDIDSGAVFLSVTG